jgi:hypothetical protein
MIYAMYHRFLHYTGLQLHVGRVIWERQRMRSASLCGRQVPLNYTCELMRLSVRCNDLYARSCFRSSSVQKGNIIQRFLKLHCTYSRIITQAYSSQLCRSVWNKTTTHTAKRLMALYGITAVQSLNMSEDDNPSLLREGTYMLQGTNR